jgi:hypothetical protein
MRNRGSTILIATLVVAAGCDRSSVEDNPAAGSKSVTNTGANVNASPASSGHPDIVFLTANAALVRRYADESSLTPATNKLVPSTTARTMPFGDQTVATLEGGTDATVFAKKGDYYLMTFPDPQEPTRQLAGWIYKDGLGLYGGPSTTWMPPATFTCKSGEVYVLADAECAKACVRDTDCSSLNGVCDGNSPVATDVRSISKARYCILPPQ